VLIRGQNGECTGYGGVLERKQRNGALSIRTLYLHDKSTFAVLGLKMESQLLGRFIACFLLRWFSLRTVEGLFCGNGNNITEGG